MPWVALLAVALCAFTTTVMLVALAVVTVRDWDKFE